MGGQMVDHEGIAVADKVHAAFNNMFQFPYIAGPGVLLKQGHNVL